MSAIKFINKENREINKNLGVCENAQRFATSFMQIIFQMKIFTFYYLFLVQIYVWKIFNFKELVCVNKIHLRSQLIVLLVSFLINYYSLLTFFSLSLSLAYHV